MSRLLHSYLAMSRAALLEATAYRAQILIGMLLAFIPLLMMAVWLAVVDQAGPAAGWQKSDFVAYYVGVAMVQQFTASFTVWEWERDIRNGDLSSRLLKPLDPFHYYLTHSLGRKINDVLLLLPVIALAVIMVPELRFPLTPVRFVAFLVSVLSGFLLNNLMGTTFGMISFWTTQSSNLFGLWFGIGQFLSGWIAPLALFPSWFSQPANVLPFHSTLGLPVEILTGHADAPGIAGGLLIALVWIVTFALVYRLLWRRGLARYEAVGS